MSSSLAYLDSSAAVKLVLHENESKALRDFLREWPKTVSSELLAIELTRAVRREDASRIIHLDEVFAEFYLHPIGEDVVILSGLVEPAVLKSLDAIHLGTAVIMREAIGCFVTYDRRLAEAAVGIGLPVVAPV